MNAIEIKGLTKSYKEKQALCGLDMTVPMGAIYGLIGENGSGKSTSEKLICGLIHANSGSIKLFDRPHTDADVRAKVGVLIEAPGCFSNYSVWNNMMLLAFFVGAMLGGAISGLPFDTGVVGISRIMMCMLAKLLLVAVFVPIYLLMSVIAKQKTWVSMMLSLMIGMLFFMMIPMLTPLDSTIMNVVLCLAGGAVFSTGFGVISNVVLRKTSLV